MHDMTLSSTAFAIDLHVYDPVKATWMNISGPASGTLPYGRDNHGFASAGEKLYVMGGQSIFEGNLNEDIGPRHMFLRA
jgi:hypothetical protein